MNSTPDQSCIAPQIDPNHAGAAEPVSTTAVGRLNLSRSRIRQNMLDSVQAQNAARQRRAAREHIHWIDSLKSVPGGAVFIHAMEIWWSKQPLRAVAAAAADALKAVLKPIAKQHPMVLVLGAFALGSALAWSKPWRWISKPVMLSGLLAPALSKVISNIPSGFWAEAFNALSRQSQDQHADPR